MRTAFGEYPLQDVDNSGSVLTMQEHRKPPRTFSLGGPSQRLDMRISATRPDIADVALADRVFAPHYAEPLVHGCVAITTPLLAGPSREARAVSELLLGEQFAVVDVSSAWAWGYCLHDHYVGYLPVSVLAPPVQASHVVASPAALVFAEADMKSLVRDRLPFGAQLLCQRAEGNFIQTDRGFVHRRHVRPLDQPEADAVAVAERLIGTPYRWGGRSGDGIDCSGLLQQALASVGVICPRDSDQQAELGRALGDAEPLARGDLVFFPGHVGVMADGDMLVHANAFWMSVVKEPLADVVARLSPQHAQPIIARRRLP